MGTVSGGTGTPSPQTVAGTVDESERPLLPQERPIAHLLAAEGKKVKALKEGGMGRSPDALVDGQPTEFKTLDPGATSATVRNVVNNSIRRGGQARSIIIDAKGSGLTQVEATRGLSRLAGIARGKLDYVRIIGDEFDVDRNFP